MHHLTAIYQSKRTSDQFIRSILHHPPYSWTNILLSHQVVDSELIIIAVNITNFCLWIYFLNAKYFSFSSQLKQHHDIPNSKQIIFVLHHYQCSAYLSSDFTIRLHYHFHQSH